MKYKNIALFLTIVGALVLFMHQNGLTQSTETTVKLTVPNLPGAGGK